jgi:tetratricopeptide (TPR) repeat protein
MMDIGDPAAWAAADQLANHLGTVGQRQQVARAYVNLADAAVWLGHYRPAADFLRRATTLARESGAAYQVTGAEATGLRLEYAVGRWTGLAERAATLLTATAHMPIVAADARLVTSALALVRGDRREAAAHADAPGLRTPADGCAPQIAAAATLRARALLALGDPDGAHADLVAAIARTPRQRGLGVER